MGCNNGCGCGASFVAASSCPVGQFLCRFPADKLTVIFTFLRLRRSQIDDGLRNLRIGRRRGTRESRRTYAKLWESLRVDDDDDDALRGGTAHFLKPLRGDIDCFICQRQ